METEHRSDKRNISETSQTLLRGLAVLEAVAFAPEPMGTREIARHVRLPVTIAQRLIATLASAAYLEQDPDSRRYRVGYRAFEVGSRFVSHVGLVEACMSELRTLTEVHRLNSFVGVLRDTSVLYLATLQSQGPVALRTAPGDRTFLHTTALGKSLLAELTDEDVRALLARTDLPQVTPRTKCKPAQILEDVRKARRLGYSVADGENLPGVISIGAAVRDATGRAVAAISIAALKAEIPRSRMKTVCELVTGCALRISRRLGSTHHLAASQRPKTG